MNEKINVVKSDGTNVEVSLVCCLQNINSNASYIYYTLNEEMGAGDNSTVKIYVSKLKSNDINVNSPITDEEWNELKGYMADALKGTENANIKYIKVPENIVSISDKAIAMPINYDYINKQRSIYTSKMVSSDGVNTESTIEPVGQPISPTEEVANPNVNMGILNSETTTASENSPLFVQDTTPILNVEPSTKEEGNASGDLMNLDVPSDNIEEKTEGSTTVMDFGGGNDPYANIFESEPETTPSNVENTSSAEPVESINVMDTTIPTSNEMRMVSESTLELKKIDLAEIEERYIEMFNKLQELKEAEIEAANRYNATIELSELHKEQHANYVANQQNMEAPKVNEEVSQNTFTSEPTPVSTIVPEASNIEKATANTNFETNWFDLPQDGNIN